MNIKTILIALGLVGFMFYLKSDKPGESSQDTIPTFVPGSGSLPQKTIIPVSQVQSFIEPKSTVPIPVTIEPISMLTSPVMMPPSAIYSGITPTVVQPQMRTYLNY